ncbi:MAG: hypothetical protein KAV99_07450, partial [Candidatus Latescibacteria bacterium]|nr:hypothetical protein [Candidatus Latescibacterota bacterium]
LFPRPTPGEMGLVRAETAALRHCQGRSGKSAPASSRSATDTPAPRPDQMGSPQGQKRKKLPLRERQRPFCRKMDLGLRLLAAVLLR